MEFPSYLGALPALKALSAVDTVDWAEATAKVRGNSSFCVVGHHTPDADAIGSVTALVKALTSLGKTAVGVIGQTEPIDTTLMTIPGADQIQLVAGDLPECEVIIVVDCGSASRLGTVIDAVVARITDVILIDHHASNPGCGGINVIDYRAESTTTILWQWFCALGVEIDSDIAHGLYAGLLTDTQGFRWGRPVMHEMAKQLVDTGLDIRAIGNQLFGGFSVTDLKIIGTVLAQLSVVHSQCHTIAVAEISYEKAQQASVGAVESIAEMIKGINEADICVVIKEYEPGFHGVSLRSDTVDVSTLAQALGGGGHLRSAGFRLEAHASHIVRLIVEQASQYCPTLA
ncbi:exopolyphosphatase-like enzyme [Corynebacterium mustelae]|uniref:Exopolyphosphatase-like enzyme n=1 Tax=Corynebacterium mustelae TaxID=571915 RepID=A0A0G3GYH2_9CORY|nr:bifunctional oligoribonuclease/PAP phosphatase NrnA [Corynebacterium mustelae]AKK06176.1 exopolyphosphatase-like enzyme [Corynebacterium mustelae]